MTRLDRRDFSLLRRSGNKERISPAASFVAERRGPLEAEKRRVEKEDEGGLALSQIAFRLLWRAFSAPGCKETGFHGRKVLGVPLLTRRARRAGELRQKKPELDTESSKERFA